MDAPYHLATYVTEQGPHHTVKRHTPRQYSNSGHGKLILDAITGIFWLSEILFVVADPSSIILLVSAVDTVVPP